MHNLHGKGGRWPPSWCWLGLPGPTGEQERAVAADKLRVFFCFFLCFFFWEGVFFVFLFFKKNRSQNKTELQNPKVAAFTLFIKT